MSKRFVLFAVGLVAILFLISIHTFGTDIPKLINYQGMLTDNSGTPLSGSYNLNFKIWTDTTGGSSLWTEIQNGVQVQNGLFNVILGKVTLLNLAFDQQYWLEVGVGGETMPRIRFTSVGYAYRALVADTAFVNIPSSNGWIDAGTVVNLQNSTDSVGIGTAIPSAKLDVSGDINASSSYKIYGSKVFSVPNWNVFVGLAAGYSNTTGGFNTIIGTNAGDNNTTGNYNIYMGSYAGRFNTKGSGNIAIGSDASYWDSSGSYNTVLGYRAGHNSDTGSYNVFIGYHAGYYESGSNKLYIANNDADPPLIYGDFSASRIGLGTKAPGCALHIVNSGSYFGMLRIQNSNTGNNEATMGFIGGSDVGHETWVAGTGAWGISRDFVIGLNSAKLVITAADGNVGVGTTSPGSYKLAVNGTAAKPGGGSWDNFSDIKLKEVKSPYECGLKEVGKLNPVHFSYKKDNALGLPSNQEYVGLVAQDVQRVIPEAVNKNDNGYLMLNNDPIIWAMLNAIKELKAENELLIKRIEALESR